MGNRLKGVGLISPDDTLNLVRQLTKNFNRCRLQIYDSGAMALEFDSGQSVYERWDELAQLLSDGSDFSFLTPEQLNTKTGIPMLVARERLLKAEREGLQYTLSREDVITHS